MRTTLFILSIGLSGCATNAAPAPAPSSATITPAGPSAYDELNQLDPRKPVPLLPMMAWHQKQNMQDHLVVIQQITSALATEDWPDVAKASARIESTPQELQMCRHMGAGAEGFTELALSFHEQANAIGKAAHQRKTAAVLSAVSDTLKICTTCHATYRQDVMSAANWRTATGNDLPTSRPTGKDHR